MYVSWGTHISIKYNNILKILVCNKINNTHANYTRNNTRDVYVTNIGTHFTNEIITSFRLQYGSNHLYTNNFICLNTHNSKRR